MSEKITNPYAVKKKPLSAEAPFESASASVAPGSRPSGVLPTVGVSSFSQAFDSIQDTQYYTNKQHNQSERTAQRAFEGQGGQPPAENAEALLRQSHVLYYAWRNRDNPLLDFIRNVPKALDKDLIPDFLLGSTSCALHVTLKKHMQDPTYILERIAKLGNMYTLRVLLVLVNVDDNAAILRKLNHLAVVKNLTLLLAWSEEEAARYLETYKSFDSEGTSATSIQKREQTHFPDQAVDFLSKVVNKTDTSQLLDQFSDIRSIAMASKDELAMVHGMGDVKVQKLFDAFHKPFSAKAAAQRKKEREKGGEQDQDEAGNDMENDSDGGNRGLDDGDDHDVAHSRKIEYRSYP